MLVVCGALLKRDSCSGNDCSIKINYSEKAKRKRELIVVVNNNELKYVVDTVCFDTFAEELTAGR